MERDSQIDVLRIALVTCLVLLLAATVAASQPGDYSADTGGSKFALLVGVSEYENLPDRFQLQGPSNDVALVSRFLGQNGFEDNNVTILADGIDGARSPTRAAIFDAFEDLIERARRGDFVYVHFSGHGSQQPAARQKEESALLPETDGFDEIFLPRDVGFWDGSTGFVEKAILDQELGDFITRLRNLGVFVWAVFDACHSGTLLRSVAVEGEQERRIDFGELMRLGDSKSGKFAGSSDDQRPLPEATNTMAQLSDNAAGFVAFYAAQTSETTPELRLPIGGTPRQPLGLFTFVLSRAIDGQTGATYRQVAQRVLQVYDAMGRSRPTPLFEGTALDAAVFQSTVEQPVEQWPLITEDDQLYIQAGSLQELGLGSLLAVVSEAVAPDAEAVGYLEIAEAGLMRSRVAVPEGEEDFQVPERGFARLVQRNLMLTLRVAEPDIKRAPESAVERVQLAVDDLRNGDNSLITLVGPGEPADLRLAVDEDALWLVPPWGEWRKNGPQKTPSVDLNQDSKDFGNELRDSLYRIAKVTNLLRLAGSSYQETDELAVSMTVRRGDSPEFLPVDTAKRSKFSDGDRVRFNLYNVSRTSIDVTLLFVDSRWGIFPIYPLQPGVSNRIESGGYDFVEGAVNSRMTIGVERVVAIAVPAERGSEGADFSFLAQETLPLLRSGSAASKDIYELLARAGFRGGIVRGLQRGTKGGASIQVLSWETR